MRLAFYEFIGLVRFSDDEFKTSGKCHYGDCKWRSFQGSLRYIKDEDHPDYHDDFMDHIDHADHYKNIILLL